MNILYFSVHQILEDDEVRLFQRLGHSVICLGSNGPSGTAHEYRPRIQFSAAELHLYERFTALGGRYTYGSDVLSMTIPPSFMHMIDVTIVMHDPSFIRHFWDVLRVKPIVWRTIGQGVDKVDDSLSVHRKAGLSIVRYSPIELEYEHSIGCDAIIRFGKSDQTYAAWRGDKKQILTFSNLFAQRYPEDFADYEKIIQHLPAVLGGSGNDAISSSIGAVSWQDQLDLLKSSMVYLYASGSYIPYTLNLIEAWLCGIPLIVYSPKERQGKFFEIDRLIEDGSNGFICRNINEARCRVEDLLGNKQLRQRISVNGRATARNLFNEEIAEKQWADFLGSLYAMPSTQPVPLAKGNKTVTSESKRIFDTISLLRPFDIDVEKIHIGNERDGGYILADNFSKTNDIISFGVGPDVTFELEMARRGHRIFLHDHTVEGPGDTHDRFTFRKVGVGGLNNMSPGLETMEECLEAAGQLSQRLLLKMDIEGYEWDVFSTMSDRTLERFDQIVMEVHWLENISSHEFDSRVSESLKRINRQFTLFHVHANNCAHLAIVHGFTVASVLELSFVRSSLVKRRASKTVYPTSLNKSNHPSFADHPLLFYPFIPTDVNVDRFNEVVTRIDLQS